MVGLRVFNLKLFLCLLGLTLTIALDDSRTELKRSRRGTLDNDQTVEPSNSAQTVDPVRRSKRSKHFKKVHYNKRCFLGSPYGCPGGFEDALLDYPRPWGWGPGPLYPEYGPDFHRGWAGHGRPFGCNSCGCGGPWRVPGCSCGCNNPGWCCCGQDGGGGGANDCPQFNDVTSFSVKPHRKVYPPLLNAFMGKQANLKGPFKMKQRGHRRQNIPCGATNDCGSGQPQVYQYPYQGTYGSWQVPQQTYGSWQAPQQTYGNWQGPQQTYGSWQGPQQTYGSWQVPQETYGSWQVPQQTYGGWQVPQETSPLDKVVGSLILWKGGLTASADEQEKQNKKNRFTNTPNQKPMGAGKLPNKPLGAGKFFRKPLGAGKLPKKRPGL